MTAPTGLTEHDDGGLDDGRAAHALVKGALIGFPVMFAIVVVIGLAGGAELHNAVLIAAWPALVGGPFFGGAAMMALLVRDEEHHAATPGAAARPDAGVERTAA